MVGVFHIPRNHSTITADPGEWVRVVTADHLMEKQLDEFFLDAEPQWLARRVRLLYIYTIAATTALATLPISFDRLTSSLSSLIVVDEIQISRPPFF